MRLTHYSLAPVSLPARFRTRRSFANEFSVSEIRALLTSWTAAIERFTPQNSAYRTQARDMLKTDWAPAYKLVNLHGVLMALRADYEAGFLRAIEELIHADLFAGLPRDGG